MDLEKNKPLAREITRRLLDAWRLKRGYKYRSEKRVTHRKLYLALMKEIMHEISHRNIRDIILQRISFFNHNYQTSLSMDQFNDLMSAGYQPPKLPSELDASMEIEGEDDDQDLKMLSPTFASEAGMVSIGESKRNDSKDQILFGQPDGLASLHGYQSDNEGPQNDIVKNSDVRSSTEPDEVQPQEVVHLMDIKSVIEDSIQLQTVSSEEEPFEKSDIRTLFSENELLRAELEPMLVYRDDPDMYDRIIAPDIRGKKFKVSNDGRCPKCRYKRNVFVILDFLFPMGDMPDICNYLIAKGQAVLWSSQDDSHCKDPPTLLCRGRCPADPAKCGFNLNWNRTDLESIFLFPEQAMETKNILTENSEQSMASVQEKENDKKTHASFPGVPSQASQNSQPYVSTTDLKQKDANIFDDCQVDMDHYKKRVSWVVLDNFAEPNEEAGDDEDQLIKTMLALSDAKEDWDQGVAKLWSSESEDDKEDLDVSEEETNASDKKEVPLGQTEKKSYAFSWSSYGSNPWAPVDFEKKKSQSSASKIIMVATGKAGVPQLLTPLPSDEQQDDQVKKSEASISYKADTTEEKNKTAATTKEENIDESKDDDENRKEKLSSSSGETTSSKSEVSSSKDKPSEKSKTYTAADYPVSKDGACPYCKSNDVVYIIINEEENNDGEDNDDDLPDILKKLLKYGFAYKMPKDENELPSFQCLSCTYGFNLDWRSTDLDKIFSKKLEEAEKLKDEDSVSAKSDATKQAASAPNAEVNLGTVAENPVILAASAASYPNYNYQMPNPAMSPAYQGYYADPYMYYARMGFPTMAYAQGYFPPSPGFFPPMGFAGYMPGPMPGPMAAPMHGPMPHHIEGSAGMYTSRLTGLRNPYGFPYRRRSQTSVSTRPHMSGTPAASKPEHFKGTVTKSEAATTAAKIVKENTETKKTTSISEDFKTVDSEKKEVEINHDNIVGNKERKDDISTVTEIVATVQDSSTLKRSAVTEELQEDESSVKIEQISDVENSQPLVPGTETADLAFNAGTEKLDINAIEIKVEGRSLVSPNIEPLPPGISESISEDSFHQLPQYSARRNTDEPASETGTTIDSMDTSKPVLQMNEEIGLSENISETAGNRDAAVEDMRGTDAKKQKLVVVDGNGDDVDSETAEDALVDTKTKKAARGRGRGRRRGGGRGRGKAARAKKK